MKRKKIVVSLMRFGGVCGIVMNGVYMCWGEGRVWCIVSVDEVVVNVNLFCCLVLLFFFILVVFIFLVVFIIVVR